MSNLDKFAELCVGFLNLLEAFLEDDLKSWRFTLENDWYGGKFINYQTMKDIRKNDLEVNRKYRKLNDERLEGLKKAYWDRYGRELEVGSVKNEYNEWRVCYIFDNPVNYDKVLDSLAERT